MGAYTFEQFETKAVEKFVGKFKYRASHPFRLSDNIVVICDTHGETTVPANNHLHSKYGCALCGNEERSNKTIRRNKQGKLDWNEVRKSLLQTYGDRYDIPEHFDGNVLDKLTLVCHKHGAFTKHLFVLQQNKRPHQCQRCRHEDTLRYRKTLVNKEEAQRLAKQNRARSNKSRAVPFTEAVSRFQAAHGDRFTYDEESYSGISRTIKLLCSKHGWVEMNGGEHLVSRHGCPRCAVNNKSKAEEVWLQAMSVPSTQHTIVLENGKRAVVDGFDASSNTIYEFLGDFWHGHPSWHTKFNGVNDRNGRTFESLFEETEKRLQLLHNMGYNIVYAWESDTQNDARFYRKFNGELQC